MPFSGGPGISVHRFSVPLIHLVRRFNSRFRCPVPRREGSDTTPDHLQPKEQESVMAAIFANHRHRPDADPATRIVSHPVPDRTWVAATDWQGCSASGQAVGQQDNSGSAAGNPQCRSRKPVPIEAPRYSTPRLYARIRPAPAGRRHH